MKPMKYRVFLSEEERKELERISKQDINSVKTILRANILLSLDESMGNICQQKDIAKRLGIEPSMIYNIKRKYVEEGWAAALYRKKRKTPAITPKVTGDTETRIIALVRSEPPAGKSRWTLRLLAEKIVELQILDSVSNNTIDRFLKKHKIRLIN
jgi:transposase